MNLTPYGEFVKSRAKKLPTLVEDFLHMAVGMSGEAAELLEADTLENVKEELGDFCFYWEGARQAFSLMVVEHPAQETYDLLDKIEFQTGGAPLTTQGLCLCVNAGAVLDYAKKLWIYNKPIKEIQNKIGRALYGTRELMTVIAKSRGWELNDVEGANRDKLLLRYPSGYSDQAAQARADKVGEEA
jgi:hypothetical protein